MGLFNKLNLSFARFICFLSISFMGSKSILVFSKFLFSVATSGLVLTHFVDPPHSLASPVPLPLVCLLGLAPSSSPLSFSSPCIHAFSSAAFALLCCAAAVVASPDDELSDLHWGALTAVTMRCVDPRCASGSMTASGAGAGGGTSVADAVRCCPTPTPVLTMAPCACSA